MFYIFFALEYFCKYKSCCLSLLIKFDYKIIVYNFASTDKDLIFKSNWNF